MAAGRSERDGRGGRGERDVDGGPPAVRLVRGERYAGWEAVYLDNVERLYRLMFAKVGNRQDAEDLTAEVFLAALGPMRATATVGEVRAYLIATARTVLASYWRRTLGREVTTIAAADVAQLAEPPAPAAGRAQGRVAAILAELPPRYRRILQLRFLESRSAREAAEEMGVSVGNAKVLQHRALRLAAEVAREVEG
jgi:RNA polymerase sigma-70 factor, ECF subfamily